MTTRVCPHCRTHSHFTKVWEDETRRNTGPEVTEMRGLNRFLELCDNCGAPVCGWWDRHSGGFRVWPTMIHTRSYPDVPGPIASAASEAHQSQGADAPRAAVAMARAVVEATAKDKGITVNGIHGKIEELYTRGHISEAMKEAAHEIRFAGNEVAHGDLVAEPIGPEEAREIVELMDAMLERVYQEPAKVARLRAGREARKAAGSTPG